MDCSDIRIEDLRKALSMAPDDGKLAILTRTEFEQAVSAAFSCGQMTMALMALCGEGHPVHAGALGYAVFKDEIDSMLELTKHYMNERKSHDAGGRHD